MMLFDYDDDAAAFHPDPGNPVLAEWRRKNIENYLLIPDAWKRAVLKEMGRDTADLLTLPLLSIVDDFFVGQNLTLPPGRAWRDLTANIFQIVDGQTHPF